jgi:hypothetical protein
LRCVQDYSFEDTDHSDVQTGLFRFATGTIEIQNRGVNVKRSRGRGRRPQNNHSRAFDSTGPDVKIRGTASHVYEKYLQLARDAGSAGDRVMAENYLQHAEHYFRILLAQGLQPGQQSNPAAQQPNGDGRVPPADQPQFAQPVNSAPSFSLADADDELEEGDEAA